MQQNVTESRTEAFFVGEKMYVVYESPVIIIN
jgi:hypothetical protein